MKFNDHKYLEGSHAFLSASGYHWLNYDKDKLVTVYRNSLAKQRGTELHQLASDLIRLGQKLPKSKKSLNLFVNDAIGYKMTSEQILFYSENCFGTADAISFRDDILRIHDLKTGATSASMKQLYIYAALFCLEYRIKPGEIQFELRIYQNDEVIIDNPTADDILPIMDKIISFDKIIRRIREEEA